MLLPRLFVLGDSISLGYGPSLERSVQGRFSYSRKEGVAEAMKNLDIPQGANGGDSSACLQYLRALADADVEPVDVLLLNCGLHDARRSPDAGAYQVPIEEYNENLKQIVALQPRLCRRLAWVRTTPVDDEKHHTVKGKSFDRFNSDVDAYNAVADRVMSDADIAVIDLHGFSLTLGSTDQTMNDGVHFIPPFNDLQGAFIAGWLEAACGGNGASPSA